MNKGKIEVLKRMLRNMQQGCLGWSGAVATDTAIFEEAIKELEIPALTGSKEEGK